MNGTPAPGRRWLEWLVWVAIAATVVLLGFRFLQRPASLPVIGTVAPFRLTNQFSQTVTPADLRGQVWIADVIFTRCPGPCREMSLRMAELQKDLPASLPVRFVSLTADPVIDTPAVLADYARTVGAASNRWIFLTGPKAEIYRLAIQDLKLTVMEQPDGPATRLEDLFLHSTTFVVVDRRGRLRGAFDLAQPGRIEDLKVAVRNLVEER